MSPVSSSDSSDKQTISRGHNASSIVIQVPEDQKPEKAHLLESNDKHTPVIYSSTKHTSRLPPLRAPPRCPPTGNTMHTSEAFLAHPEEWRDEESRDEDRQGEEGGGKEKDDPPSPSAPRLVRDLAAFWLLGFCNNFTYWVMITAAYDLLAVQEQEYGESLPPAAPNGQPLPVPWDVTARLPGWSNDSFVNTFTCNQHSTGAILVADTLPATALTLAAPLTMLTGVGLRVGLVSALCVASYLVLGLAPPTFMFLGVALASASRGFSDTTFLGYASNYHKHVLSLWSSGTGVATFVGPLLFSAMTTFGLHPRHALLTFLVVPIIIMVSFWCVLSSARPSMNHTHLERVDSAPLVYKEELESKKQKTVAVIKEKIYLFGRAQKYLLPLAVFYLIMYFTNQGLLESVYFPASHLSHAQQYSWSITVRCLGTLVSRSSHKLFLLPSSWLYCIFAVVIMAVVGTESHYHYLPSEYVIFALLLAQGLLEGAAFRTTVFTLHKETSDKEREFCLGIFPISLFLPAMLAGFASIPIHDFLCQNHVYRQ
ncbi:battenin-like [Eriocheir sinensis]|uniref:battenin-like n=1 Tax=Eriocheir sinensis TaxID=95602 RepID=UPI0021C89BA4|nr:battenin-like [Eriocheir sinensis]